MGSIAEHDDGQIGLNVAPLLPLAIIGLSFRFPQEAVNSKAFWKMIIDKRCASTDTPPDRWRVDSHHHPDNNRNESLSIRGGHYMTGDLSAFDAPFFSVGASEAEAMDPAQRLTLETAYRAIENAGIPIESIAGSKTCVYSGSFSRDYATMLDHDPDMQAKYRATGTATNMLANRVSWFFDLKGPSVNVDTACSSSLVALDLVCQSIWCGDATMGLACGSNTMFTPEFGMALDNLGMLGPDSRCYSFDHRANGYARGEGFGVLVVKPLDAALRDGDTIRAVIRSSASNQDGKTPGVTQPSLEAQEQLIINTYAKAGLDLGVTRYFEAHGTGTPVGDPIEAGAIGAAFRKYHSPVDPLYVGSVKSNIGHLEGSSGIAGVIKSILALEAGVIPPNSNFEKLNPKIDAEFLNIKIATDAVPWPTSGLRRASIQSFGFGGSNSHIVLDDAFNFLRMYGLQGNHNTIPAPPQTPGDMGELPADLDELFATNGLSNGHSIHNGFTNGHSLPYGHSDSSPIIDAKFPRLLVWSTMDESGVGRIKDVWKEYLGNLSLPKNRVPGFIRDLAHTLAKRRSQFAWRTFAVARQPDDLPSLADQLTASIRVKAESNLAFVFSGQGAQWHAMGRELIDRYPVYKHSLIDAGIYLTGLGCPWDPIEELSKDKGHTKVNEPDYSQTLCTVLQVALVDIMNSFGIKPAAVVGHSSGEIAAAYCAGAFSRQAAWKIAYFRGQLAAKLVKISQIQGRMMAVGLSSSEADKYLKKVAAELGESRLVVACVNSPKNVTVSGEALHIKHLQAVLDASQIFARELKVNVAYHSFQMREMADEYLHKLGSLDKPHGLPLKNLPLIVSSVTGNEISRGELSDPMYWVRNLVSPVLFSQALATICSNTSPVASSKAITLKLDGSHRRQVSISDLVEVGPHSALQGPIREILLSINQDRAINYMSMLVRNTSAVHSTLELAGRLYCLGYPIDVECVNREVIWTGKGRASARPRKSLVSLPDYPFNHSKSYWTESRLSKNYRFRKHARHDLLGVQATDWNPLEAKWRNIIKTSELPWVEDHKINSTILYPAAGMLVMAIEACKQLADETKDLAGFLFKNVSFHSALNIPTTSSGIEVNLCMRPRKDQDEKDTGWHDFRLYTYSNEINGWHENCNGSIQIVYEIAENEVDKGREQREWTSTRRSIYMNGVKSCTKQVGKDMLYGNLAESGYGYGPTFRLINQLTHNGSDTTVADVEVYRWSNHYEGKDPDQPHTIHPTTLDCILQGILTTHTKGGTEKIPTAIPTHVEKLWISKKGLSHADANLVKTYATGRRVGMRETESHLITLDETETEVLIDAECFKATDIGSDANQDEDAEQTVTPNLCHTVDWKTDLDLLSAQELQLFCDNSVVDAAEPIDFFTEVDFLLTAYIRRTLKALKGVTISNWKPHTQTYYSWMKHRMELLASPDSPFNTPEWKIRLDDEDYISKLTKKVATTNKQGLFYTTVGLHHIKLLTGEEDALSLLFNGDLVKDHYYEIEETSPAMKRLGSLLDAIVHKNPGAKFLEVGAGTGAMTHQLMKTLTHHGDGETCSAPRYSQYDYTDLSPFFFAEAQTAHGPNSRMQFKTLNIETDPETQGYESGTYDGIFAAAVLHATTDLTKTLEHCRKLLKPGGKLMLFEPTLGANGLRTNFAFGLLEGWWLSTEPYRKWSPCLDEHQWDEIFKKTGFSGNDCFLSDYKNELCHEFGVLVTTAVESSPPAPEPVESKTEVVIIHGPDQDSKHLARNLQSRFEASGIDKGHRIARTRVSSVEDALDPTFEGDSLQIFLLEFDQPVWYDIDPHLFASLQKLLASNPTTRSVWVAYEQGIGPEKDASSAPPSYRLIDGLSRVLNSEVDGAALTYLALQPTLKSRRDGLLNDQQISHIVKVSGRLLDSVSSDEVVDTEYKEKDGILHIPRLIETTVLNEEIYKRVLTDQIVQRKWVEPGGVPLRLIVGSPGLLNTLRFVEDRERNVKPLDPNEVEVEVKSVGLNFRDLLIALGRIQNPTVGCECAGIVTRLGSAVPADAFKVGDRVASFPYDTYKSFVRINWRAVAHVPDEVPLSVAAAVPVNYATAWMAFKDLARLQPGETVLIHSAAGGTGQAAIQVAQHMGATVLATVGIDTKKQFLVETYGISPDHIFSSRDPASFARGVKRVTSGKGVDVVFNSLSGEGLVASWECIAPYGRFIEIGKKDILARNQLPMSGFEKNVTFSALDISTFPRDRPHVGRKALEEVFALIGKGTLKPAQPLQAYGVSEIEKAFRTMQSGKTFGKIVVDMRPDDIVEATLDTKPSFSLQADATYVIAGGLGGIGRSMARWLVERGARNLILLSRSGIKNQHAEKLITELGGKGAKVATPACDVSDAAALKFAITSCLQMGMPPIRGCIQASMVLRDAAFAGMTHDAWQAATAPKTQGTWNLHTLLPVDMDFFVTLSSICGIVGSRGQANYGAGNTFQDALVRHRISLGQRAAALDLGPVFSMGVMTEDEDMRKRWEEMVEAPVTEADLFALLDYYCNPANDEGRDSQRTAPLRCQAVVGLARWLNEKTVIYVKKPISRNLTINNNMAIGGRGADGKADQQKVNFASVFANAESLSEATEAVTKALARKVSSTLSLSLEELDITTPLHSYGVDSLVAVELRNWFAKEVHADIAIFDILGGATIATAGALAAVKSRYYKAEWS